MQLQSEFHEHLSPCGRGVCCIICMCRHKRFSLILSLCKGNWGTFATFLFLVLAYEILVFYEKVLLLQFALVIHMSGALLQFTAFDDYVIFGGIELVL